MTTTSAQRDEYRFTDTDEARIRGALAEAVRDWGGRRSLDDVLALTRIGAHCLGLSLYDLRGSEAAWLDNEARLALGQPRFVRTDRPDGSRHYTGGPYRAGSRVWPLEQAEVEAAARREAYPTYTITVVAVSPAIADDAAAADRHHRTVSMPGPWYPQGGHLPWVSDDAQEG